ncbi:hypothetical protein EPUS_09508 [Endocarpon pusillum Z07020]|uniref:RGS domain-containing protein n=1 Tax=Endocarpon pusillum (strain Z07020 / HMAS-L-300199) TaxID=1263415 RepID=U1FTT4_ENDPU|nr:uncharacterized protein EPUS_09508 [Endocarpon pusillum Z07020]ERF68157.1 hypothetical protein EPUS_09508 [Endocarpon pusillum Z07020]
MCADISHQPCTTREFMNFLLYIENSAENLQFYLWFRDYVKRFDQLPENEKNLSPPWVPEQSKLKIIHTKANSDIDMSPEEKRTAAQEVSQAIKGTDFDAKAKLTTNEAGHNPFSTPPRTPVSDKESMSSSMAGWGDDGSTLFSGRATSHTKQSAAAFETAKAFQPFTVQPYREEISRIIATYITSEGSRCLNLSDKESAKLLRALSITTHPSAFREVVSTIERTLRHQAHPNFIRYTICNGNRPRVIFARGLGIGGIVGGLLCAVIFTLSSAGRGWRALSAIGFFIGIATLIAAWKGMCVVLHGMHHRHLRPWELFSEEDSSDYEMKKDSMESHGSNNSYENEPWIAKYEKRNVIRKIFDREVWIQEPALRQIQDTIFLQAVLGAFVLSAVAVAIFVPLPKGNYF